jgi:hypothetical protein
VITHHWGRFNWFNWFNCQNQKPCPRVITLPHDKKKEAKSLVEETNENKMANKKKRKRKRRKEKKKKKHTLGLHRASSETRRSRVAAQLRYAGQRESMDKGRVLRILQAMRLL